MATKKEEEKKAEVKLVTAPAVKKEAAEYITDIQEAREQVKAVQKMEADARVLFRQTQNNLRKALDGLGKDDRFKQLGANYTGLITEAGSTHGFLEHSEKMLRELAVLQHI